MKRFEPLLASVACVALLTPATGMAQEGLPVNVWGHGTTLGGSIGASLSDATRGAAAGALVGWEVTPTFGIEGEAAWLDHRGDLRGFQAAMTAHLNFRGRQTISPYVKGGIGLYRMEIRVDDERVPDFYRRRLGPGSTGRSFPATFTDPSVVVGAGVNLFAGRRVAVRPEVEVLFVTRAPRTQTVPLATLQFVYHFEEHLITPARRSR